MKYRLILFGNSLPRLREFSLRIKKYRFPDVYKGKGIKFIRDKLSLKPGRQSNAEFAILPALQASQENAREIRD